MDNLLIKDSLNFLAWTQGTGMCTIERDGRYSKYVPIKEEHYPQSGFRCEKCGAVGHKPVKTVTKTRPITYYGPEYENGFGRMVKDIIGQGYETVEEKLLCQRCVLIEQDIIRPEGK